jgi:cation diffusion facilitator family transporter
VVASLANLGVAMILMRAGKRYSSITLQANSRHLMTDVWTSGGVLIGVGLVALTGWQILDPIIALLVAANIIWSGVFILRSSISGLMDVALPAEEQDIIRKVLEVHRQAGVEYHALRTRQSGALKFISLHILVPGEWSVHRGHQLLEHVEADISEALPNVVVFTHLESLNDPSAWDDIPLSTVEADSTGMPGEK